MNLNLENSTKIILKVFGIALTLAFVWVIRDILLLLLLSLILASAMDPMVEYFNQRGRIPRAVSVLTVYVIVFGLAGLVLYLLIPPAIVQLRFLSEKWPEYLGQINESIPAGILETNSLSEFIKSFSSDGQGGLLSHTFGVFNGFFSFITVLVISFYLVAEEKGMKKFIATLLPVHHQAFTMQLVEKIQRKMGLWVLGQIILSVVIFAATFIGLTILGVDYALFLALLAGMLEIVPYIGPFVSAVPAVFFAIIQSPPLGLAVVVLYILIQKAEGYVLVPKVMEKTVGTSPLVVLLALLVGFKLAGVLGLLISVPLASAVTVVIQEFFPSKNI